MSESKLEELAARIRKEVESMAEPGEKWTVIEFRCVSDGPRISVTLYNPQNATSGARGYEINASNCDDLKSVMVSLRSEWAGRARDDEEYAKALLEKCGPGA